MLEVLLAMGLLVMLSTMTYWFYSSGLETSRRGTSQADTLRLARVVLDRIATEIRQTSSAASEDGMGLIGDKERIFLSTLRVPTKETTRERSTREAPAAPEYDLVQVEYKIARHPDVRHEDGYELPLGLARIEKLIPREVPPALAKRSRESAAKESTPEEAEETPAAAIPAEFPEDEETGGKNNSLDPDIAWEELYAPPIHYLRFCFHDGAKWWDDWQIGGENPLPQLVMITIGFEGHPPCGEEFGQDKINEEFCECLNKDPVDCKPLTTDQFSTVVRVTGADPLFRSRVSRESQAFVEDMVEKEIAEGESRDEEGGE